MAENDRGLEIPKNINRHLATISKIYSQAGKTQLLEIIVNAKIRIIEQWEFDGYNKGHALYLTLPETIFLKYVKKSDETKHQIQNDLNKIHNSSIEYIAAVFLEMEISDDHDWRKESGVLMNGKHSISKISENRIWEHNKFRVFLSHKNEVKMQTAQLKEQLHIYGVSCFVAHEDIHPTIEWQNEIENALFSMDAFVALMTEQFHDSYWTDQEVGVAFGRGIPIISVKLGKDPYGFIGKFQAVPCSWNTAAKEIVTILFKYEKMISAYIEAVKECSCFEHGNLLAEMLYKIDTLNEKQENDLVLAFNENIQVHGSFGFLGKKPSKHGRGLAYHLTRITGKNYVVTPSYTIEIEK